VPHFPWWGDNSVKQLHARLDEGNQLFEVGNYSAAAAVFQDLRETGRSEVVRPALYGLACSRFMLASNKEEWIEAVTILELWQRVVPVALEQEDPRMLLSLFEGERLPGGSNDEMDGRQDSKENFLWWFFNYKERTEELEEQIVSLNNEIEAYREQRNAMEESNGHSLEEMKASMAEMEAANQALEESLKEKENALQEITEELSKLRDQIKTLETIDQEIQEKKQGISSP
jgi:hypothetical protein